jgi:hypothetical protein
MQSRCGQFCFTFSLLILKLVSFCFFCQLEVAKTRRVSKNRHGMDAYDCIIGEYCDPGVEKKYLEKLHHDKNSHRVNALKRMPIQTRISEGMLYNILSLKQNEVFLPEQKRQAELKSRDPEPTMGYLHNIEVRERDHKEQQLKLERATHRISKQRWAPIVERGYDITSNEPNVNSAIAQGLRRRLHELKLEPEYDSLHGNYV